MNALAITTAIFISVLILFATDKFRVGPATLKVTATLAMGAIMYMFFAFIMSLFGVSMFSSSMYEGGTGLIFTGILLFIATISLVLSFESARHAVESGAAKEAEWHIAAGLFFSLIYLYYLVVRFLLIIAASNRD